MIKRTIFKRILNKIRFISRFFTEGMVTNLLSIKKSIIFFENIDD